MFYDISNKFFLTWCGPTILCKKLVCSLRVFLYYFIKYHTFHHERVDWTCRDSVLCVKMAKLQSIGIFMVLFRAANNNQEINKNSKDFSPLMFLKPAKSFPQKHESKSFHVTWAASSRWYWIVGQTFTFFICFSSQEVSSFPCLQILSLKSQLFAYSYIMSNHLLLKAENSEIFNF